MDVREKLVELLDEAEEWANNKCDELDCETCPARKMRGNCFQQLMVGRLIANGVTVQEWIPAEEPPEEYRDEYGELIPFLVCEEGTDYPFRAFYDGKNWGDGIFAISVKWWMRLPAPPKEKERKEGADNG